MEKDIPQNIEVYYLDKSFAEHYMFIADNIIYKSADSVVYSLKEYTERHNKGLLDGWITFREAK